MFERIRLFYPIISVHQTSLIGLWRTMLWTKHRFNIVQQRILLSKKIEGMLPSGKSMLWSAICLIQLQSSKLLRDSIHSIMTSKTFNLKFKVFQTFRALWSLDLHEYKFIMAIKTFVTSAMFNFIRIRKNNVMYYCRGRIQKLTFH